MMASRGLPTHTLQFLSPRLSWRRPPASKKCIPWTSSTLCPTKTQKVLNAPNYDFFDKNKSLNSNHLRTIILGHKFNQHRDFRSAARQPRDHHFDTLKFVRRLQEEGFTEAQSVAMMKVLSDVIEESIRNLTRTMVLREDQAKATYTQKVDFAKLRTELLSADSTESATTRATHERLTNDLAKLNSRLRDEINRTQASVRLDLNLEKGRIREEANVQELKIKETETKIEQAVAHLREKLEGVKFQTLQWLMGVCTGTAALILGAWRLLM
ncbi:BgTH12-05624 [Blumeria graminis f. sp. triticale]|uniref:BgTH12-05624 n=1 Tax=Blumeria graminis f. sp. triticale TaxID=1689686 RepID=A0A9W4D9N7_BLUGR|nr:BgTH12-05624 [Blumeria graminis f. sp. triticale]